MPDPGSRILYSPGQLENVRTPFALMLSSGHKSEQEFSRQTRVSVPIPPTTTLCQSLMAPLPLQCACVAGPRWCGPGSHDTFTRVWRVPNRSRWLWKGSTLAFSKYAYVPTVVLRREF